MPCLESTHSSSSAPYCCTRTLVGVGSSRSRATAASRAAEVHHHVEHRSAQTFFCFVSKLLLSSSTRRRFYPQRSSGQAGGHRCRPFPPVRAFIFIAHRVRHSHCSSILIECCPLSLSRFPLINFYARKVPRVHALDENRTREIDFSKHEDNLPSHRGRLVLK